MKKQFRIWVLTNRYVEVGYGERINDPILGECLLLTECSNVEYYGTTKGLTELSMTGPTSKTRLRPSRSATIPLANVVKSIEIPEHLINSFIAYEK